MSPSSTTGLFTDDSILYRAIRTLEDAKQLHEDLDKLQEWERKWLIEFHLKKYQVLLDTSKRKLIRKDLTIHRKTVEETDGAKYLNVYLHKSLSWNSHID